MVRNVPNTGHEKIVSQKKDVQGAQQIRLRRFGMAVATYSGGDRGHVLGHPAWARGDDRCAVGNLHRAGADRQRRVLLFVLHKCELALFRCVPDPGTDRLLRLVGHGAAVHVARGSSRGVDVLSARFQLWHATPDATSISQRGSMRHGTLRIGPGLGIFSRSSGIQVAIRVISVRFVRHLDDMVCFFRRLRVGYEASLAIAQ